MTEIVFIKNNADKWKKFETQLSNRQDVNPDELAELYIELTDDLSYSKTFFPKSKITHYLNALTAKAHHTIYKNRKEESGRFKKFWTEEIPLVVFQSRKHIGYSFIIFMTAVLIGAVSSAYDEGIPRLILGDSYVNMTIENIKKGDPMGVYGSRDEIFSFASITFNNIRVSFYAFVMGIFFSVGTGYMIIQNGIMLGAFQYFFYRYDVLFSSVVAIWIHGTLEITAIIIAGGAGLVLGNSFLFPGTYSRLVSFRKGASQGSKLVFGLIPIFITAGFLEGFVTRHYQVTPYLGLSIIGISSVFILYYFVYLPKKMSEKRSDYGSGKS